MTAHVPVMLNEVIRAMSPRDGEVYVDGTFGAGGYSRALLESCACRVYAIDRDPNVAHFAQQLEERFADRFVLLAGCFSDMIRLLAAQGVDRVNGIMLDIGVSSMQLEQAERGFSFRNDGPLDMRMAQSGMSAADVVNGLEEAELADIIYQYGEERASRRIAKAIVAARAVKPFERTHELAQVVHKALGGKKDKTDPATRTFQALRIYVNDELGELSRALSASEQLLTSGGRMVVVTFHSLEDRIVKNFFQLRSGETGGVSRHLPTAGVGQSVTAMALPTFFRQKKLSVSDAEAAANRRARSAKLRVAVRSDAPAGGET